MAATLGLPDYASRDAVGLARHVAEGGCTARQALDAAYSIIARFDPQLNAFVSLQQEQAYAMADAPLSGPLAGVPIAMKDCVGYVKDVPRDFGSRLTAGTAIDFDDEVVARMKRAGVIPMGTSNVPEFSSSISTESVLHGPCRNPWNPGRSTGGSSGGAAAAVACGAVPIAYGNDAAGSIRIPASCCGLFGFKPSRGRVPTGPLYSEYWFGLMVHHVITRSVRDSAVVLDAVEGIDAGAPYGVPDKAREYAADVSRDPGKLRIAVSDGSAFDLEVSQDCVDALDVTTAVLTELGHDVVEIAPDYSSTELVEQVTTMLSVALAQEIPAAARDSGRDIGPDTVEACHRALMQRGLEISAVKLAGAIDYRNRLARDFGHFLQDYDAFLTPTLAAEPVELGVLDADATDLDTYLARFWNYCPFTPLANLCGTPSMSVPLYWNDAGLPIGVMFTGRYADEATLFALAGQLERARPWGDRHPPLSIWSESR